MVVVIGTSVRFDDGIDEGLFVKGTKVGISFINPDGRVDLRTTGGWNFKTGDLLTAAQCGEVLDSAILFLKSDNVSATTNYCTPSVLVNFSELESNDEVEFFKAVGFDHAVQFILTCVLRLNSIFWRRQIWI